MTVYILIYLVKYQLESFLGKYDPPEPGVKCSGYFEVGNQVGEADHFLYRNFLMSFTLNLVISGPP